MEKRGYVDNDLKGRMLRHASTLWGIKNTDALDPLVKLLIEALAGELDKTYHDIDNFENRILEKVAVLMTPGLLSAPYCAHAIAHARPVEITHQINPETHFLHRKKTTDKESYSESFFTPIGTLPLVNGEVKYIVVGNKGFMVDANFQKHLLLDGHANNSNNVIWLGLQMANALESLDQLRFYFDIKNTENQASLLSQLQSAQWEVNGRKLITSKGAVYEEDKTAAPNLFSDYDPMDLIEKEIKHFYHAHFLTVQESHSQFFGEQKQAYPIEFEQMFASKELSKIVGKSLWIKITLSSSLSERRMQDLFVCLNAFPVLNRRLKKIVHRFKGVTNLIPIHPDFYEYFLSVNSLKDGKGLQYSQIPFSNQESKKLGTYSIRKGGTERIDTRSAKEFLGYLTELVRDESAAFSSYGQETVGTLIKEMDKLLAQIDQRIKQNKSVHLDSFYYVALEFEDQEDVVFFDYWVTNGPYANYIHSGSPLLAYEGTAFESHSLQLLTNTMSGKRPLDASRHMDAYKYAMLTHNRLITIEDIKSFCLLELGDKIEAVSIRKALVQSDNPKEGLVRCLEVSMKAKKNGGVKMQNEEWKAVMKELKSKMELRSAVNLNYRLRVED